MKFGWLMMFFQGGDDMATIEVGGRRIEVDEYGHLVDYLYWNEEVAKKLAATLQIELTPEHLEVVSFLRWYFEEYRISPMLRILQKELRKRVGDDRSNTRYLYNLFPAGPAASAAKIAGIPKPAGCG